MVIGMKKMAIILILFLASVSLIGCREYLEFEYKLFQRVGGFMNNSAILETTEEMEAFVSQYLRFLTPEHEFYAIQHEFGAHLRSFDEKFFRSNFILLVQDRWVPGIEEMEPLRIQRDGTIIIKSVFTIYVSSETYFVRQPAMTYVVTIPRRHINLDFTIYRIVEKIWENE